MTAKPLEAFSAIVVLLCLAPAPAPAADRDEEVFRYACRNPHGRRDVTLFANGTVRLREGLWEEQRLELAELEPEELASALGELRRIRASIELPPTPLDTEVVEGEWVEHCEVALELEDAEPWSHRFTPYAIPPLAVASLIHVAEDLAEHTRPPAGPDRLPADYEPRTGDVLRSADGDRFRVLRPTLDGEGVELEGLDSPLRIYVALDRLAEAFEALESRAPR